MFALLSEQYGFGPGEVLKLTQTQFQAYMRNVRVDDSTKLEYEKAPGTEEFMAKVAEAYRRSGKQMPPVKL